MQIKLVLDPGLHSQNKGHWRAKAALVKQARSSAAAQSKLQRVKLSGHVTVDYHFRVPDRRRRDLANMIHSCKPFIDGVVDSGTISGDHWEVLGIGAVTCEVVRTLVTCEVVLTFHGVDNVANDKLPTMSSLLGSLKGTDFDMGGNW